MDSDGNWSFDSPKLFVSQNNEGNINYSLNSIPNDELSSVSTPFEQYTEVSQEVEQVRK